MLFECKASFAHREVTPRAGRAKVGIGGKNGTHFLLIGFASSREKLPISAVDKVQLSKNKNAVTISFTRPQKVLIVESHESGDNLMQQFARTVAGLKKGDDKKLVSAVPSIESIESRLKLQPKSLVIEGSNYDVRQLHNNQLQRLTFSGTKLLPREIWSLDFVNELHLTNCHLDKIPIQICRKMCNTLTIMDLSNNKITTVDAGIMMRFKNLKHLNLSNNLIRCIPLELVFIKMLMNLDFSRNQISKVPFTIGLMRSLKHLNLSHNRLDHFPESIIRPLTHNARLLLRLDSFDLSGNEVSVKDVESGPGRNFIRSESLQQQLLENRRRKMQNERCKGEVRDAHDSSSSQSPLLSSNQDLHVTSRDVVCSPPSLFEISCRSVLKCTKVYRVLDCWLPRTVYEFLQQNSALCSSCAAACVAYRSELVNGPGHFSLIANTMQSDASTSRIPIVRFICWHCSLKQTANSLTPFHHQNIV